MSLKKKSTGNLTNMGLTQKWARALSHIDFAFQPIVTSDTGVAVALEALVRHTDKIGFAEIDDFYNAAFHENMLYQAEIVLREKAVQKFCKIPFCDKLILFYNYDHRIHLMDDYRYGITEKILRKYFLATTQFCFELSEKNKYEMTQETQNFLEKTKQRGFPFAIDDFGAGFSGLELFYKSNPNFIKFDRFLISHIDRDHKKKIFAMHLISLAKALGVTVIAEGVETMEEMRICRELGFDLIQGYFVQKPQLDVTRIQDRYYSLAYQKVIYATNWQENES